ncbi:MAG: AAA family ATPase [Prevotella sp.]
MTKLEEDFRAQSIKSADSIITSAASLPTEQEKEHEKLLLELKKHLISVMDEYPPEECLLKVDGVPFFAKGDISAIKAKQKQGKTNAISLMVAAILCGNWGQLVCELENARVMVIDTEQKPADTQLIYNRTLELAGLPKKDIFERFRTFNFRALSREDKIKSVKLAIMEYKPDIVFIDGIVDLMGNFNEVDDSKVIIEELMRLSTKEVSGIDIAIVCVLHTNKATDDHNMRGHVGTMLAQKSGTVLEVRKSNGIITVSNSDARHKEVPEWSFRFDDNGNIVDATQQRLDIQDEIRRKRADEQLEHDKKVKRERFEAMAKIVNGANGIIKRSDLNKALQAALGKGRSAVDGYLRAWIADGIINEDSNKRIILTANNVAGNQQNLPFF